MVGFPTMGELWGKQLAERTDEGCPRIFAIVDPAAGIGGIMRNDWRARHRSNADHLRGSALFLGRGVRRSVLGWLPHMDGLAISGSDAALMLEVSEHASMRLRPR